MTTSTRRSSSSSVSDECHHDNYSSPFVLHHVKPGQWVQVAVQNQSFRIIRETNEDTTPNKQQSMYMSFPLGTPGRIIIDDKNKDGDSILLELVVENDDDDNTTTTVVAMEQQHVSCFLEPLTPLQTHQHNVSEKWHHHFDLYMRGVQSWYNHQDYLNAMELWDHSMACLEWNDNNDENDVLVCPPALRGDAQRRVDLGRRLLCLASCWLDANDIQRGRLLLKRALYTLPKDEHQVMSLVFSELMLTYQEEDNNDAAQQVASWAIQHHQCCGWKDAMQRPGYMYPMLTHDDDDGPYYVLKQDNRPSWCHILEQHWEMIRHEFDNLWIGKQQRQEWPRVGSGEHRDSGHNDHMVVSNGGDWREWVLFGTGAHNIAGGNNDAPHTKALLRQHVPDAIDLAQSGGGEVIFSILAPHTRIKPHCGGTNLRLTAHLGLVIPSTDGDSDDGSIPACGIRVRDTWHTWKEGQVLVFDDSYEHEVRNDTDMHRAVLLIRFWHPSIPVEARHGALSEAIRQKEMDICRRYNPPLPLEFQSAENRGMEQTRCRSCMQTGYNSVRVLNDGGSGMYCFVCACGGPIV